MPSHSPLPDGLRLDESLAALERQGFQHAFRPEPGALLTCTKCEIRNAAETVPVLARCRVEGVSDPSDESLVIGLQCPSCHSLGTLVLAYGPRARRTEVEVLDSLGHMEPIEA